MTLNITVLTSQCIYQCADYRLTDRQTNTFTDFETQKVFLAMGLRWSATVCFAGVGATHEVKVHEWLSDQLVSINLDDPFERVREALLAAESWLSSDKPPRRHSFSVGAFVGTKPIYVLVSNFQTPSYPSAKTATKLCAFQVPVRGRPMVFVAGQKAAVLREERIRLRDVAAGNPAPERMHSLLAEINRAAATRTDTVSPACYTTRLTPTGEVDGQSHGVGDAHLPSPMPFEMMRIVQQVADAEFGHGRWRATFKGAVRGDSSDEHHEAQLREKPNDPSVHSNYGAFLKDHKNDPDGAEREYRQALELDPNHTHALGNLANLMSERGDTDYAKKLYVRALEADPRNTIAVWNFVGFLVQLGDRIAAKAVLDTGLLSSPQNAQLLLHGAQFSLESGSISEALGRFTQARENHADQAQVEAGYPCALHLSGAPVDECIGAYRTGIALNPKNGALLLNLAQLLFLKGAGKEALKRLDDAQRLGLDESAQLEALFYRLCHTASEPEEIFRATKALLDQGARLRWDVAPNIETVRQRDPRKADLLEQYSKVVAGEQDQSHLDEILLALNMS